MPRVPCAISFYFFSSISRNNSGPLPTMRGSQWRRRRRRMVLLLRLACLATVAAESGTGPLAYPFLGRYAMDGPPGSVEMDAPAASSGPAGRQPVTHCQIARHDPNVGWPGYSRPNGSKHTSDAIFMPASRIPGPLLLLRGTRANSSRVRCHLGSAEFPLITSGNATLSVLPPGCPRQDCERSPSPACCTSISGYLDLFVLFEVQFGRRPYFYEQEGSFVVLTDVSLRQQPLRLTATLPGGVLVDANVPGGRRWRIPFSLQQVPTKVTAIVNITLEIGAQHRIVRQRRFARHPPPAQSSGITAFQLDHERGGALRAGGAEFLAQGWFNGGFNHHVDGLGARSYARHLGVSEPGWFIRQSLNLGSIAQHWGSRGLNFVRFQSQVFTDWSSHTPDAVREEQLAAFMLYLDECARAGVFVLLWTPTSTSWPPRETGTRGIIAPCGVS